MAPGLDSAQLLYVDGDVKGVILDTSDMKKPVTITIVKNETDEVTAMFFPKKMQPVTNVWRTISHPGQDSVTLQWYMDFQLRWYPWEKFGSLMPGKISWCTNGAGAYQPEEIASIFTITLPFREVRKYFAYTFDTHFCGFLQGLYLILAFFCGF
ncbi:MAG: hypothetical protein WDO16_14850 [Bacteroidota bacterium]